MLLPVVFKFNGYGQQAANALVCKFAISPVKTALNISKTQIIVFFCKDDGSNDSLIEKSRHTAVLIVKQSQNKLHAVLMIAVVSIEHSSDETVFAQSCLDGQFEIVWPDAQRVAISSFRGQQLL